ncbi:MAG: RsmB/NOP family class I SAM-dependent RNA methyltransferase, partial [Alistipes sp.]|nr:RsmB/NOP family class I SAM-dependent RNA methyltransferase [Alistipes sp.]
MPNLPPIFTETTTARLGRPEAEALFAALDTPAPTSIRFNPYKVSEKPEGEQVPWSRYGFYLDERPVFTADPLLHGGAYYVQEAGSMFLEAVFTQLFPEPGRMRVLDLCAAPGGKSTHLSALAGLETLVVANETIRPRAQILSENVRKWGLGNTVVTNNDPERFGEAMRGFFDLVVVDAPCSGEGMFRKTPEARREWTPDNVRLCAARQQRILSDVWDALREGGVLIYSTCTFNRSENEDNVRWMTETFGCEAVHIDTSPAWGVVRGEEAGIETFRFYPHRAKAEGFFLTALRKAEAVKKPAPLKARRPVLTDLSRSEFEVVRPWIGQADLMHFAKLNGERVFGYYARHRESVNGLAEALTVIYSGVEVGQIIHNKLKPEHALALFHDVSRGAMPCAEL